MGLDLIDLCDSPLPVEQPQKKIDPDSMLGKVATLFMRKRGLWLDSSELAQVGGRCGWRTRVSECRTRLGMDIRNQQRDVPDGKGGTFRVSSYGYKVEEAEGERG